MAKQIPFCHRVSRLFQPTNIVPFGAQVKNSDVLSKSSKLMVDEGVIAPMQNGFFYLLPLAMRSLDKLVRLIDKNMAEIGAQKIACPSLTASSIWKKTGRLSLTGPELFQMKDRHGKSFILSPTHEESITQLLATLQPLSYKQLPLLLYQVTTKFRDEARPRYGLVRSREFLMKDLYSFDSTAEAAQSTYHAVSEIYHRIFKAIGVSYMEGLSQSEIKGKGETYSYYMTSYVLQEASVDSFSQGLSGTMGGKVSHEFHYPTSIGDDTLRRCQACGHSWNKDTSEADSCDQCGGNKISETKGIEVGHLFQLDTRYSEPLQAIFTGQGGKEPLVMGSYGLGLTRLLAASVESLSLPDQLRWPYLLAPYTLLIITPKEGSKESKLIGNLPEELYWRLQEVPALENDVMVDDRTHLTIGKRILDARRRGFPYIVVVGKEATAPSPRLEFHNILSNQTTLLDQTELINTLIDSAQYEPARINIAQ